MDIREIEEKWVKKWEEAKIFEADVDDRPKIFVTFPFPYMNGPLHIGHAFTSTRVDIYARFKRMQGFNVLFPWAWHLTGEPIAGAAKRLAEGDVEQIRIFKEIDEVPEEELKKFTDPVYMANYYIKESREVVKKLCHSIDWRREFTTTDLHKPFSKFIEWQYLTLRELGYVRKGTHPVVWCPHCKSPTGDHDRLKGEGVSPTEFILLKFKVNNAYLVSATLRPETIFGVTNIWLKPDTKYVKAKVDGENWILSKEAFEKLKEQKDNVEFIEEIDSNSLFGRNAVSMLDKREVPILPATFVDTAIATGVVMSVPSHAPYDYAALKDLKKATDDYLKKYNISREIIENIKPISLIKLSGYGEHPAIEIVEKMKIEDQNDERLEEATEIIYREEFYKGILKENTGKYAGKKVNEVKKELISDFISLGIADKFYDLTEEVVCRCKTRCIVKVLKDQWFLKYSDKNWKEKVKKALKKIKILPEEARRDFENVVDWLEDKACARKTGLGTPLPWDKEWKVETLSDSTVYMAFYTISKVIYEKNVKPETLTKEVFDYVFYGKGDKDEIAKRNSIDKEVLDEMRKEFEYWYPVDLRVSAKELIPNHLTFYIFHHVALFEDKIPRIIGVNGMINIEGEKMSKSKGNFITIKKALKLYGASTLRASLMYLAEGLKDPDFRHKFAEGMKNNLLSFYDQILNVINLEDYRKERKLIDDWLLSVMQRHIESTIENLEELNTRSAFQSAFFDMWQSFKWYIRRDKINKEVALEFIDNWLRLLAPYIPALCEELWEKLGKEGFISLAKYPEPNENLIRKDLELGEETIATIIEDIENIIKFKNIKPKKIAIYVAEEWKWNAYMKVAEKLKKKEKINIGDIVKDFENKKEVASYLQTLLKSLDKVRTDIVYVDELRIFKEAKNFLEKEFNCEFVIYRSDEAEYDPMGKARLSSPLKPAIYIE